MNPIKQMFDSVHGVTIGGIAVISLSRAETWAKILSAAIPAAVMVAYTIWKWRKEAKNK